MRQFQVLYEAGCLDIAGMAHHQFLVLGRRVLGLAKVLGAILLITGAMQIAAACGMRGRDQWTLMLGGGILTLVLGLLVFMMPGVAILVFAVFTGVQLLFLGVMMIRGGSEIRRVTPRA